MVVVSDEAAPVLVARGDIAALAGGAAMEIHAEGPLASLVSPRVDALASTPELAAALRVLAFPSRTLILQGVDGVVVALCERDNAVATIVYGETSVRIGGVLPRRRCRASLGRCGRRAREHVPR